MPKRTTNPARHYATDESRLARYATDWRRSWLVLGEQMAGGFRTAGDAAAALVQTALPRDLRAIA